MLLLLLFLAGPTAAEIMREVGLNQDRAQQARTEYVYDEQIHCTMRGKNGKLLQEEYRVYTITPQPKGVSKKLQSLRGKCWKKGRYVPYTSLHGCQRLMEITLDDDDNQNKDSIEEDLFPLATSKQAKYHFELTGERTVHNRPAYQIQFRPADNKSNGWTGEALVDQEELQPVSIYTQLSRRLPFAVRNVLGTDVPGLGFSIQYTRLEKDVWFPATFGSEFGLRALFFLNRTLTENTETKNFRRSSVQTHITYNGQ